MRFLERDGKELLMTAASDGLVRFWYLDSKDIIALAEELEYRPLDDRELEPYQELLVAAEER